MVRSTSCSCSCGVCIDMLPEISSVLATIAATHSVAHGVALLDAQEPFLQKSGCNRVRLTASASDANVQRLVDAGAPAKLVAMLQRTSDDGANNASTACGWLPSCPAGTWRSIGLQ